MITSKVLLALTLLINWQEIPGRQINKFILPALQEFLFKRCGKQSLDTHRLDKLMKKKVATILR